MRIPGLDALQLRDDTQLPPDVRPVCLPLGPPAPVFDFVISRTICARQFPVLSAAVLRHTADARGSGNGEQAVS